MAKLKCPKHDVKLIGKKTRFGMRWDCPIEKCTVVCWGGRTSTPADYETRVARHETHMVFDPLWQSGMVPKNRLFKRLSQHMGLPQREAHIGMFNRDQCQKVMALCKQIRKELTELYGE